MSAKTKTDLLRERNFAMGGLPETIRVPPLGQCREEVVKPLENATVDDIAFAILAMDAEFDAFSNRIYALRKLHTLARQNGALGSDRVVDAIPVSKETR